MSKAIKNYDDLLAEEQRLLMVLRSHENLIKRDFTGIKESMKPFNNALQVINKFTTRDPSGPLVNFGLDFSIDLLVRRFLLARAGWLTKIVIPFIMKNYSSHIISDEKREKLTKKIKDFFSKIRPKADYKDYSKPSGANAY
ncbi:MAG: hypothetical protein NVS1B13_01330 [Flavisolibacter sp.]